MVYNAFLQTIQEALRDRLTAAHSVIIRQVPKNNGVLLDGLCISKAGETIAPTIYLNPYYRNYEDGMSTEDILDDILTLYRDNCKSPKVDFNQLADFSKIKTKVAYKLIQSESNSQLLSDVPFIPYLDLAIVFYLFLEENENGQMTALVHNDHLEVWGITLEYLYQTAMQNTPLMLPAQLKSMLEVMKEFAKENLGDDYREEFIDELVKEDPDQASLYVLTNTTSLNGACCILYKDQLKNFADELGQDLVILPSSIHEVLLVPDSEDICYHELRQMVAHINESEVPVEDQLSNQIYYYSKKSNQVSVIEEKSIILS